MVQHCTYIHTKYNINYSILQHENPFGSERPRKPDNLPQDRSEHFGDVYIIDKSSEGFLTYAQVLEILNRRESETKGDWSPEVVAKKYRIDPKDAENLMKYYSSYRQADVSSKKPKPAFR